MTLAAGPPPVRRWPGAWLRAPRVARGIALALSVVACGTQGTAVPEAAAGTARRATSLPSPADTSFGGVISRLSEPGGYFDTDNLISNEASYLHAVSTLRQLGVRGGAFLGVGPDQNFSYVAAIRPSVAFMVDLRRDNLLEHLLFKAIFTRARNRAEYLALLFGRPVPEPLDAWDERPVEEIIEYLDAAPSLPDTAATARRLVLETVRGFGVPLAPADLATIDRFHASFIAAGLDLRFTSINRPARPYYPTYRQLLIERDREGRQASYLANEADWRFVRELQRRDRVIPVVGDLAGEHALPEIGRWLHERGERVSAFYTSNVEYYLMQDGSFERFVQNVAALPRAEPSVIIRSCFGWACGASHPETLPGYFSTQLVQRIPSLLEEQRRGGYRTYADVVTKHVVNGR
ncbi:MAG TPA: hypothetical protein VFY16_04255 [Gemmatimonadaceae bacterium]|jgi:hypothetical protein|nr:hypothetical protein [Gemmatimonadaceae bacterium]